jgi:hypothetical protein
LFLASKALASRMTHSGNQLDNRLDHSVTGLRQRARSAAASEYPAGRNDSVSVRRDWGWPRPRLGVMREDFPTGVQVC